MKKYIVNALAIASGFFIITSCEDNFLDVNTDPDNPAEATIQDVLPPAISSPAYVVGGWYQILGGIWSQHWTQSVGASQYQNIDQYDIKTDDFDSWQFSELYAGGLNDQEFIRKNALEQENWNFYLMATTMQVYTYQVLVDLYGDIPFEEALQGNTDNFKPHYNSGPEVYDGLIARLDEALSKNLDAPTSTSPGAQDVLFNGNMDLWVAFANTLKLKIFIRQSFARPDVARSGIKSLYDQSADFLNTSASFIRFADEQNRRNPFYETEIDGFDGVNVVVSNTLLKFLQNNNDVERLAALINYPEVQTDDESFDPENYTYIGLDQGDFENSAYVNGKELSKPKVSPLAPVFFLSAWESYFLQAEAAARFPAETGLSDADAELLYQRGIEATFENLGLQDTLSAPLVAEGGPYEFPLGGTDEAQLEAIITQKWIGMVNSQGLEAYFEYLRTGYPDFFATPVNSVLSEGEFPQRLLYPDSEVSNNPNTPEIKPITTPVFWDTRNN